MIGIGIVLIIIIIVVITVYFGAREDKLEESKKDEKNKLEK